MDKRRAGNRDGVPSRLLCYPDYSADPLWTLSLRMVDLDTLPLSEAVKHEVRSWAAEWERLAWKDLRAVDVALGEIDGPAEPPTESENAENERRGRAACQQLRSALAPDVLVGWASFSRGERWVQWDPDGLVEPWPAS